MLAQASSPGSKTSPNKAKLGQNLKYDTPCAGQRTASRCAGVQHDTLLQSYVLEAHKTHGLEAPWAERYLGRKRAQL